MDAEGAGLVNQINFLAEKGKITGELKKWATIVRWIGNDAAHPDAPEVAEEDARDALHLAEQFLTIIFVTPAIAEARKNARGK